MCLFRTDTPKKEKQGHLADNLKDRRKHSWFWRCFCILLSFKLLHIDTTYVVLLTDSKLFESFLFKVVIILP